MQLQQKSIRAAASAGLLLASVIWGFAFVVVKNSLEFVPPIYTMAFRFTVATAGLCLIFFKKLRHLTAETWKNGTVLGILLFISYVLQTVGCKYTTAGKNAFLTTIYVVLVPFLHYLVNRKKTGAVHIAAAVIAITGIGLLSLRGDLTVGLGDGLTLLCGVGYAVHIVYIDRYTERQDPVLLTVLQMAVVCALSWIAAPLAEGGFPKAAFEPGIVVSMLYLGLFSTMLAFLLQTVGQKYTAPSTAAILLSLESLFGVLFAFLFLDERLSFRMAVGCVLIFAAVVLSETPPDLLARLRGRRGERVEKKSV